MENKSMVSACHQPHSVDCPGVNKIIIVDFSRAAMEEQKHLWLQAEGTVLQKMSQFYKDYCLNKWSIQSEKLKHTLATSKSIYNMIDLNSGELLMKRDHIRQYSLGFDGGRFVQLTCFNKNDTEMMNELRLFNSIKEIDIHKTAEIKFQLVQGVPDCGKTTFNINNRKDSDLILFPTQDAAADFRKDKHPEIPTNK
ncbi:hypothetical protein J6590_025103 [Homalodisca vitripennis]|nr:hypothetical protein J6590_103423 [Homalodisca vitripennis]KAG8302825.1 hypothetical protein J6590_025103 [Homalodisca vitripennis]